MTASLQTAQLGRAQTVSTAGAHGQSWNECAPSLTCFKHTSGALLGRHWESQI